MDSWDIQDYSFERTPFDRGGPPHRLRETTVTVLTTVALLGLVVLLLWVFAHHLDTAIDAFSQKLADEWIGR